MKDVNLMHIDSFPVLSLFSLVCKEIRPVSQIVTFV